MILLPTRQYEILRLVNSGLNSLNEISRAMKTSASSLMRDLAELERRRLISTSKEIIYEVKLTNEGMKYALEGLPERLLLDFIVKNQIATINMKELFERVLSTGVLSEKRELVIGMQHLIRRGACKIEEGRLILIQREVPRVLSELRSLEALMLKIKEGTYVPKDLKVLEELRRRKLVTVKRKVSLRLSLTDKSKAALNRGLVKAAKLVTRVTPEIILERKWNEVIFKKFDVTVEVPDIYPSRKHPYMELLDEIREVLVSMGFEEMRGPHVELEFWNFDVLFQAQDHPAREIHDTFYLRYPRNGTLLDEELMKRVKLTHENGWITGSKGWRYIWSPERALRLILRTQTTAVSVRTLYERGEGEYRCFALDRVFRPETLDAKHSMEFYQLEGIIVGKQVTFRNLLGFFNEFAKKLGLGRVKIKPAYFPFTEPSVEGFIKHPKLGWIEVFPGGMFRPEVLLPLGIKECNVAAWGIGIDRIAMTVLGIDDIRLLFSQDLSFLRERSLPLLKSLVSR